MKKRLFSLVLAFALCFGLTVPAGAADSVRARSKTAICVTGTVNGVVDQNGSLWVWGYGGDGSLGIGKVEPGYVQKTPRKVLDNVQSFCLGNTSVAVKTDGSLWICGDTQYGQLGDGIQHNDDCQYTFTKIMDGVDAASAGSTHIAVIKTDGSLWMWGGNDYGQLGNNPELNEWGWPEKKISAPVKVMDNVAAVSCGGNYTAAIKTDGSLWMWGSGRNADHSVLGTGGVTNVTRAGGTKIQTVPVKVMDNVASISCSSDAAAAIKTDGSLWMWGTRHNDTYFDRMPKTVSDVPVKVMDGVKAVSAGDTTSIIKTDNSLWTSGNNLFGQLGDNSTKDSDDFVKIMDDVVYTSTGEYTTCAVKSDGSFWMWGFNEDGRIGISGGNLRKEREMVFGGKITETLQTVPVKTLDIVVRISDQTENTNQPSAPSTVGGFTDVKKSDYFADAVVWAVGKNIAKGTGGGKFSPGKTCTVGEILTFLWRAKGSPDPTAANPFTDIKPDDYYYKAAVWAAENGLVSGSTFGANTDCTRAMTVEYLWKVAGSSAPTGKADFSDVSANADYAQAVAWAVENGVTKGTGGGKFSPAGTCTRGEIVTFLHRAMG